MSFSYRYNVENLRRKEFGHVKDVIYVDHAGATLYSKSQIDAVHLDLTSNLYGNPHSSNASSKLATDTVDQIRYRVLRFFCTTPDEYSLVFTSGCTDSLRLLSDSFAFTDSATASSSGSTFCFLQDNHTSVQGMREKVALKGVGVICVGQQEVESMLDDNNGSNSCSGALQEEEKSGSRISRHVHSQTPSPPSSSVDGPSAQQNRSLFAFPAQSNFSGQKYPLDWIERVHTNGLDLSTCNSTAMKSNTGQWFVLLDASSYVSTSLLDLSVVKPDFVTLSFYKMFGYPTGLGALLVHKKAENTLTKVYYGGGTVNASTATERFQAFRETLHDRFEDGTLPYLNIISLKHGLDTIEGLAGGMTAISRHVFCVAKYFYDNLKSLHHGNGQPLAQIYCQSDFQSPEGQGGIVTFNIQRSNGQFVGYAEVDKFAQLHDVHLRTGCFCNIGACQLFLGLSSKLIMDNFDAGHVCGDNMDLINGRPTGAVRISFGYMNTISDARACLRFLADSFLEMSLAVPSFPNPDWYGKQDTDRSTFDILISDDEKEEPARQASSQSSAEIKVKANSRVSTTVPGSGRRVTDIFLFPVKSCGALRVSEWEMGPKGLLYDREWILVSETGVTLSQRRDPKICLLTPTIDLGTRRLILHFPGSSPFQLPLDEEEGVEAMASFCTNKVCGDRVNTFDCGNEVSDWLSDVLAKPRTRLLRQQSEDTRKSKLKDTDSSRGSVQTDATPPFLSLANESQMLLLSRPSVRVLQEKMQEILGAEDAMDTRVPSSPADLSEDNLVLRFRANLVIDGGEPFEEEDWTSVKLGSNTLVCQGQCSRCQMICIDQDTGNKSREPLRTISVWRGKKVPFGMHTRIVSREDGQSQFLRVGDPIVIE